MRAGEILAIAQPHDVEGLRRRQHRAMAGPGVVGMAVGDHGALDRPHRIDMKAAGLAAQAGGHGHQDVLRAHRGIYRVRRRTFRQAFSRMRACAPILRTNRPCPRLFLSSGDMIADRRFEFARDLQLKGDLAAAADLLLQAIGTGAGFYLGLVHAGRTSRAARRARRGDRGLPQGRVPDPEDRHGAGLRLMRLGAEPLAAMPPAYVQALFDQYAPRFEASLVGELGYRGPALLFKAVLAVRAAARKPAFFKRAIDLGCGTGLAAAAFAREVDHFIGIDLSPRMIERAARHRPLCRTGSRRHGAGLARQARRQRRSDSGRRRHGLCLRPGAGVARGRARAGAGRSAGVHRRDPWRRGRDDRQGAALRPCRVYVRERSRAQV